MSDQEFDNYLALLGGLLRLSARQRAEIAGELRDHLEERLAELTASGVPREDAVRRALAEFGDAAGLAAAFLSVSRVRRKRWIMKWTATSIGGLAVAVLLAVALWPEGANVKLTPKAVAQAPAAEGGAAPAATPAKAASEEETNAASEAALGKRISADFQEVPLREFVSVLSDSTGVEFFFDIKALDGEGVNPDTPVSIKLKKVRVDILLEMTLRQLNLDYMLRDGIVVVTTPEITDTTLDIRVYNCRDLIKLAGPVESRPPRGVGGFFSIGALGPSPKAKDAPILAQVGGSVTLTPPAGAPAPGTPAPAGTPSAPGAPAVGGMGGGMGGIGGGWPSRPSDELIDVITTTVEPDAWQDAGGAGSIAEYGGLLVVTQTPRVHRKLEKMLTMMRESAAKDGAASKDATPAKSGR